MPSANAWRGTPHRQLYPTGLELVHQFQQWRAVVVDATAVGGGRPSFLGAALGLTVVTPYLHTAASKPQLAYDLLAAVDAARVDMSTELDDAPTSAGCCGLLQRAATAPY